MSGEELSFDEYDEIVNTTIKQIYKDNECIALQRIIKRQQKEIEELKNKITDLEKKLIISIAEYEETKAKLDDKEEKLEKIEEILEID